MRSKLPFFASAVLVAGCGGSSSGPPDAPPPDDVDAAPPPRLVWTPCAVITGETDSGAECGEADVPVRWSDPAGPRLHLFVKRVGAADAPTQMWMLNGGPGASGADFDPLARELAEDGSLVLYLPDHRGTGRSTRIGCAAEDDASPGGFAITEAEWAACEAEVRATHGDNLAAFNTTEAANDLHWMIEQTRLDGQAVNVWGGSYGTRWGQRYLQIDPAQASSVTLMGVVTADRKMADYDQKFDTVGRSFLARCGDDAFCRGRLGASPDVRAQAIWDSLDAGHCAAAQIDKRVLRTFFAGISLWSWAERALVPATLFRIERCNAGDVAALRYLNAVLALPATPSITDRLQSGLLGLNISGSEFWASDPPPLAELEAIDEAAIFSFGAAVRIFHRTMTWPRYPLDEYAGAYPDTELPVLIINGEFDPATPLAGAEEVASHYTRPGQRLVVGPDATHSFVTPTTSGSWCFLTLMYNFARAPQSPLPACTGAMLPMDFRGNADIAAYFGTTDLWDGGPSAGARVVAPRSFAVVRRVRAF